MVQHYLRIAWRNMLKYKTQSIVSIVGLAAGFTCFALANLWIHYEMTYDAHYEGADGMYILCRENVFRAGGYSTFMPYPASTALKRDFAEVEEACAYTRGMSGEDMKADGRVVQSHSLQADSCFMNMFGIRVLAGNMDFMYTNDKVAITEEQAMRLFGSTDVLGREVKDLNNKPLTVCAVLSGLTHSNLTFGSWGNGKYFRYWQDSWENGSFAIIVKLRQGTDPEAFRRKLNAHELRARPEDPRRVFEGVRLIPLDEYRYSPVNEHRSFPLYYLVLFSVAGGLVIVCSLFNYLSLFVTRIRIRRREIGLRKTCGSSTGGIVALFSVEYLYIILLSGLLGMALVEVCLPAFREMSGVEGGIYGESLLYYAGILLLSLLLMLPFAVRRTDVRQSGNSYLFRKASITIQLGVGMLVAFCMTVMLKQIYFLKETDLGWERKNIASITYIYPYKDLDAIADRIQQLPCVQEVLTGHCCLLPRTSGFAQTFDNWDGKEEGMKNVSMLCLWQCGKIISFYDLKLLEGEMLKPTELDKVLVNESAVKALGMTDPVGKQLHNRDRAQTIAGVIKDFHITPPTEPVQPYVLTEEEILARFGLSFGGGDIVIKFHEGEWKELRTRVDSLFSNEYPEVRYKIDNTEEKYAEYLKSENTLTTLLSFVAAICMLIAAFGIFSLVTLSCEQRRKEIAVRKVNGATIRDILLMFVKEYMLLSAVAAVVAFPVGYVLMKRWLESYVEQTAVSAWIYVALFGGVATVIFACIGWRVWQAARQNPAEVVKSE